MSESINEHITDELRFDKEGLPDKEDFSDSWLFKVLNKVDGSAIVSRTLVKTLGITHDDLVQNIQKHESERGRHFTKIYEEMLNNNDLSLKGSKLLEVGAGPGAICLGFQEKGSSVVSLDIKDGRIFYDKNVPFLQASGTALPFADNSFDFLSLTSVTHHLPSKYRKIMLDEAFRVADIVLIQEDCLTGPIINKTLKLVDNLVSGEVGTHHADSHMTKQEWIDYFKSLNIDILADKDYYPEYIGVKMLKTFFVLKKRDK